jgi:hypothetical protein
VEIGAVNDIEISGQVNARGGAGFGGGAGGGILVHGNLVTLLSTNALLAAGGDNGGGGGRVLIIASSVIRADTNTAVNVSGGTLLGGSPGGNPGVFTNVGTVCPLTYTVLNTNDSGAGSLRQAIVDATSCPGKGIIVFAPSAYGTIKLTSGELLITGDLDVLGPGATNVTVDGNAASRVFEVGTNFDVTLAGLTIANGNSSNSTPKAGAGILNWGSLTVSNCSITGNNADPTAVEYAVFFLNGGGGGVANLGTLFVVGSAIYNNLANLGGGIGSAGTATVVNTTIDGNSATVLGGGIVNLNLEGGSFTLLNSTVTSNTSTQAAELANITGSMAIGSTIFEDIGSGSISNLTADGTITSFGYNLSSGNADGIFTNVTDIVNTDPMLGPLQLNGGQTPTHALLCGSLAIDQGANFSGLATDQRGFSRTFDDPAIHNAGDGTDIGAYEVQQICNRPPVARCTNVTVSANSNCVANASINNGSYDPDVGDTITINQSPAGPYPLGTNLVTLTVTDSHGASNSCIAVVIVKDTTPPGITCPGNITTRPDLGKCTATVNFAPLVTDNCPGATSVSVPPSGSAFPIGTNTVHCTAIDGSGNTNGCSFTITVTAGKKCPQGFGYWKSHTNLWAVSSLTLGTITYNKTQLVGILNNPTMSDASILLAKQLITALLNQANGSTPVPICGTFADANGLLDSHTVPSNVGTSTTLGKAMLNDANTLTAYNNGVLTPGCTP